MRSIPVKSASGVEGVKRIRSLMQELRDRKEVLDAQLIALYEQVQKEISDEVLCVWNAMLDEAGVPVDERHCWYLHTQFFDQHGLAFVVQNEGLAGELAEIQSKMTNEDEKH